MRRRVGLRFKQMTQPRCPVILHTQCDADRFEKSCSYTTLMHKAMNSMLNARFSHGRLYLEGGPLGCARARSGTRSCEWLLVCVPDLHPQGSRSTCTQIQNLGFRRCRTANTKAVDGLPLCMMPVFRTLCISIPNLGARMLCRTARTKVVDGLRLWVVVKPHSR